MRFLFALLWALFTVMAYGQVQDVVPGSYTPGFFSVQNFIKNPNCFTNTRYITASGTGTIARNTTTPLRPFGDCSIGGSASGDKVTFSGKIFDKALKGQNCEARFTYAGDASKWKAYAAVSGTAVSQALQLETTIDNSSVVQSKPASIIFPCGDTSTAVDIVFESTATTPLSFKMTGLHSGLLVNGLANVSPVGPWIDYGPMNITATTTAPTKATTKEFDNVKCRVVGQDYECEYRYAAASATGAATGSGGYIFNLPTGILIDSSVPTTPNRATFSNYVGTSPGANIGYGDAEVNASTGDTSGKCDVVATSNSTFQVNCFTGATTNALISSSQFSALTNAGIGWKFTLKFRGANLSSSFNAFSVLNADTGWSPCTPSGHQGFGTSPTYDLQCKKDGEDLLVMGKVTATGATAVEAQLNLPVWNGAQLVSKGTGVISTIRKAGEATLSAVGDQAPTVLIEPSKSYMTFGFQGASAAGLTKQTASGWIGTGTVTFSINARIPIEGWSVNPFAVANLTDGVMVPGAKTYKKFHVKFDGGAETTVCSASPCTTTELFGQDWVNGNVIFDSTGNYHFTTNPVFSPNAYVVCTPTGSLVSGTALGIEGVGPFFIKADSSGVVTIPATNFLRFWNSSGAAQSVYGVVICEGQAP